MSKSKSPYAKYGKRPFRYSDLYYAWRKAEGGEKVTLGRKHSEKYGLKSK